MLAAGQVVIKRSERALRYANSIFWEVTTMKKTIRTSRTAGQLEKMFRALNTHFFNDELPEAIISLKKTVGAYGHFTVDKVWQAGEERRYEINVSSATLNRPIEEVCSTLLHEMCHELPQSKILRTPAAAGTPTTTNGSSDCGKPRVRSRAP